MEVKELNYKLSGDSKDFERLNLLNEVSEREAERSEGIVDDQYKTWIKDKDSGIWRPSKKRTLDDIKESKEWSNSGGEITRELKYLINDQGEEPTKIDRLTFVGEAGNDYEMRFHSRSGKRAFNIIEDLFTSIQTNFTGNTENIYNRLSNKFP